MILTGKSHHIFPLGLDVRHLETPLVELVPEIEHALRVVVSVSDV